MQSQIRHQDGRISQILQIVPVASVTHVCGTETPQNIAISKNKFQSFYFRELMKMNSLSFIFLYCVRIFT